MLSAAVAVLQRGIPAADTWTVAGLLTRSSLCSVVIQKEDEEGKVGVKIGRELMSVAATALKSNITRLAPLVLPLSEQLIFASNFVARKVRHTSYMHVLLPSSWTSHTLDYTTL